MICLDNTDVIEGGANVDAVVDYQIHGLVGTTFTQLAAGLLSSTLTTVLCTAAAGISVVSIILVNTHTSAVDVTLRLDPADGGSPRYLIPKTVSLGSGYSLHTDGSRITVMDTNGQIIHGYPSPLGPIKGGTGLATYTKGDLLHASASDVLAALGIGTTNHKLFVNAAGDLPEWSSGIKICIFTHDTSLASGDQVVGGVGFKPSHVIFLAAQSITFQLSIGFDNGTNHYCLWHSHVITADTWGVFNTQSIIFAQTPSIECTGHISTLGTDGFTITWTKIGAKIGTASIYCMVFR